ncbi:MAG: protein kinase [Planctomycetaceae bacterium]|nr:protein kinase [Planctomycetaceae bacterium]
MSTEALFVALDSLPIAEHQLVHELCCEFEKRYRGAGRPLIREFLDRHPELSADALNALFFELLTLDVLMRRQRVVPPCREDYLALFPAAANVIDRVLNDSDDEPPAPLDAFPEPRQKESVRPERIGSYRILRRLGEGGMGTVYLAEPIDGVDTRANGCADRQVALKTIRDIHRQTSPDQRTEIASGHIRLGALFEREIHRLKGVRHPNFIRYIESGTDGRFLYFVMEYVSGGSLKSNAAAFRTPENAAKIMETVARAMDYVHERLKIVHSDLKPRNILIDQRGQPRITDFGLAKGLDVSRKDWDVGVVGGTRDYMAPEQSGAWPQPVTPAVDIFAIGSILHFLLVGREPGPPVVVEQSLPGRPAAAVNLRSLDATVPEELQNICRRCLAWMPEDRYPSAFALAEDLSRFRTGNSVRHRIGSPGRRLLRRLRNHPGASALGAAALLLFLVFGVFFRTVAQERDEKEKQRQAAVSERNEKENQRQLVMTERDRVEDERRRTAEELKNTQKARYRTTLREIELLRQQGLPFLLDPAPEHVEGWETAWLRHESRIAPRERWIAADHHWAVMGMAVDRTGRRAVTCGADGQLILYDVASGRRLLTLHEPEPVPVPGREGLETLLHFFHEPAGEPRNTYYSSATWLGDLDSLAAVTLDGKVHRFDSRTGKRTELLSEATEWDAVACDRAGLHVLVGGRDEVVLLSTEQAADEMVRRFDVKSTVAAILRGPNDGGWILGHEDGAIEIRNDELELQDRLHVPGPVWSLSLAELDGRFVLAVGSQRPVVTLLEIDSETARLNWRDGIALPSGEQATGIHAVCLDPPRRRLLMIDDNGRMLSFDLTLRQFDWTARAFSTVSQLRKLLTEFESSKRARAPLPLRRHAAGMVLVPGSGDWLTTGENLVLKRWTSDGESGIASREFEPDPRIAWSRTEERVLWIAGRSGSLFAWEVADGKEPARIEAHAGPIADIQTMTQGADVVTAGADGALRLWKHERGRILPVREIRADVPLRSLAVSSDERFAASVDAEGNLNVWDLGTFDRIRRIPLGLSRDIHSGRLAFAPSGRFLAVFGEGQECHLYNVPSFERARLPRPEVAGRGGTALAWSTHQDHANVLAFTDNEPRFVFWDSQIGRKLDHDELPALSTVQDLLFTSDGKRLLVLESHRLSVFDAVDRQLNLVRILRSGTAQRLAMRPGGSAVAIGFEDGTVQVWDPEVQREARLASLPADSVQWTRSASASWEFAPRENDVFVDQGGSVAFPGIELIAPESVGGRLYYACESEGRLVRELIDADAIVDSRMAFTLTRGPTGTMAAAYRVLRPAGGAYDGELRLAVRHGANDWRVERDARGSPRAVCSGNNGFRPLPLWKGEQIAEVLHWDFDARSFVRSFRERPEDEWRSTYPGRAGNGYQMKGFPRADGEVDLFYSINRHNLVGGSRHLARWNGGLQESKVIDPSLSILQIRQDPTGRPAFLGWRSGPGGLRKGLLGTVLPDGDVRYEDIPDWISPDGAGPFAIDGSGDLWVVYLSNLERQIRVAHRSGLQWRQSLVREIQNHPNIQFGVGPAGGIAMVIVEPRTPPHDSVTVFRPQSIPREE